MHSGVVLGVVWVTTPRQIEVIAEDPSQPIYFELVEEIAERDGQQEVIKKEPKYEECRVEKREAAISEGEGVEADISERVEIGEEKEVSEEPEKEEPQEEVKRVAIASQREERKEEERAKVVSLPKAWGKIVPQYPKSARRKGREGCVVVEAMITEKGEVGQVQVVLSSGYEELDESAKRAVEKAKFEPAAENEQPIAGEVRMVFEFKLTK